jgi:hypothetical protein
MKGPRDPARRIAIVVLAIGAAIATLALLLALLDTR